MRRVDCDDYVGPDRRRLSRLRMIERRRFDAAHETPSLAVLLRRLLIAALDVQMTGPDALPRCIARVDALANLAGERAEHGAAGWLRSLSARLRTGPSRRVVGDLITRYVQSALAALN